ncbi:Opi1-domain-containing protein [Russula earlei]|uniref:Opi1-domain-containing protein n=1 Tax=Russula earlei TaxID=71964 RepID=A0ACC0U6B8_9AGAM|nr:Opi1-domain-containing protein [Russula earlei]
MFVATNLDPPQRSIQDEDESVRIAIRALGDMRNGAPLHSSPSHPPSIASSQPTPALSAASSSNSPTLTTPTLASEDPQMDPEADADFVARVSTLPVFSTALRAYEQSKASSRVVKYGAEMMESSLGRYGAGTPRPSSADADERSASTERLRKRGRSSREAGPQLRDESMGNDADEREPSPEPESSMLAENPEEQQQVGSIGAAVSEESMRRLKYCLQWLQYATTHIDGQIVILRDFIASLQPPPDSPRALNPDALISQERMRQLANVKRDVVATVRQVVDVVSKYAGGALPDPARTRVRGFILHLPQAWASAARRENVASAPVPSRGRGSIRKSARRNTNASGTGETSRPTSPTSTASTRNTRQNSGGPGGGAPVAVPPTAGSAKQAAQRILALATESLDMMRGVTGVVKESLDRADAWVERLRVIGLQRNAAADTDASSSSRDPPPPLDPMTHRSPVGGSAATSAAGTPASVYASLPSLSPVICPATASSSSSSLQETFFADHHTTGISRLSLSGCSPLIPNKKDMFTEEGDRGSTPKAGGSAHEGSPAMDVDG